MAEIVKPYKVGTTWTNLLDSDSGESINYQEVSTWWDGSPMDDSKADGYVYRKLPSSEGGGYVRVAFDPTKTRILVYDNVQQLTNRSVKDDLLLKVGYYNLIQLKGFWGIDDGGGGNFVLDLNEPTANHDGGGIISVNSELLGVLYLENFIENVGDSGTGCFVRVITDGTTRTEYYGVVSGVGTTPMANKKAIQACFNYAYSYDVKTVRVGPGIHEIDSSDIELRYRASNSELIFEGATIKLADNGGRLTGTQVLMFLQCSNVTVRNLSLDGNRENNPIREDDRGRQFSFSAYDAVENLHIIGGQVINSAQNHMQNTSEGLVLDGLLFDVSGEHALYLTLGTNNPRKQVTVRNCTFHRWALDWEAVGVSLRDYRYGIIENCVFRPLPAGDITTSIIGGGCIQTYVEYDSTLGASETLRHDIVNCMLYNHTNFSYSVNASRKGINGTYIRGGYLDRPTTAGVIEVRGVDINITSAYRWENNPASIIDCDVRSRGLWFTNPILFQGNRVYATDLETGGTALSLQSATTGTFTFKDNEFHNFTEDSTAFGLVRGNPDCVMILDGNRTFNCSNGRLARVRSAEDISINNKNMTPLVGNFPIRYDLTPKIFGNNSYEATNGPTAARPSFGTSSVGGGVGHRYFDTDLGKPIYWNGSNWVDATGTTV